ncbi:hypothetical protein KK141_13685 [Dyella sp. LX-66]|uniref:hypothetical protein n=1 Tax=unclassified Dyella TaxID=2634549 RepID=UPI001BDFA462|nr:MULTISPECIES: hypothetical protein [unclassified Dyella]MBT2116466.1 hypothetical protein [Dyella sp. LX-1]MBT2140591.1 hypothetical protein [Dyella sp. LX-66]
MEGLTKRMAAWPAWSRRLLHGVLFAGYFGVVALMKWLHGTGERLLVLALLVGLTWLVVYVSRATHCAEAGGDMRREDRRYFAEFMPAMAVYFALMLFVWPQHKTIDTIWLKALVAVSPALPVAAMALSLFRYVTGSDEFMQRLHVQALAIAAGVVAVVSVAVGFLAAAKVVNLDGGVLLLVFPGLMLVYGPTLAWAKRRYRD